MSRIAYVDVPDFYAAVERAADPALAGRPVVVGGDPRKKGTVQAATADARAHGVAPGMLVLDALGRCPRARALRTDMPRYREADQRLRASLAALAGGRIEPAGLGAAYLATPGGEPFAAWAVRVRERIRAELRLPLRIGAAPVKFLARLAAEEAGVDGTLAIEPGDVEAFLAPLPVDRLPGVGPNTAARLAELGVARVGELVALGRARIERALGNHGLGVLAAALGQGDDRIRAAPLPQSLSLEVTLPDDETDLAALGEQLRGLAERLERSLVLGAVGARRLALKVRYADGERITRTQSFERGLASAAELLEQALALLGRTQAGTRPLRLLGLAASGLVPAPRDERQLPLFPPRPGEGERA